MKHANKVSASVNSAEFIKNMRLIFKSPKSFIGEVLQNARRANATKVEFSYDDSSQTLTVRDDGNGIADFSKLTTFAESGWNESVRKSDQPYGMGVFSYYFAAAEVSFRSKSQYCKINCEELCNGASFTVVDSSEITGTVIEFIKPVLDKSVIHNVLVDLARGFPIPVILDGITLVSDKKLDDSFYDMGVLYFKPEFSGCNYVYPYDAYLQGLPVGKYSIYGVIHLKSEFFEAVMPDRASLYDERNQSEIIGRLAREGAVAELYKLKSQLNARDFFRQYSGVVSSLEALEILNDVPFLGGTFAYKEERDVNNIFSNELSLTPDIVAASGVRLVKANNSAAMCKISAVAEELGWVYLTGLHEDHWAMKLAIDLDEADIDVVVTGEGSPAVDGYAGITFCSAESVKITIKLSSGEVIEHQVKSFALDPDSDDQDPTDTLSGHVYVVDPTTSPWSLVAATVYFHDEDRCESLDNEYEREFELVLKKIFNRVTLLADVEYAMRNTNVASYSEVSFVIVKGHNYDVQVCDINEVQLESAAALLGCESSKLVNVLSGMFTK